MRPARLRTWILLLACLWWSGCVSGPWNPYRARNIRPTAFPAQYRNPCRLAQASPGIPCSESEVNAYGRAPLPEDLKRLAGYDLTRQYLEDARRGKVEQIADLAEELAVYEQQVAGWERAGMDSWRLEQARAYIAFRKASFIEWIDKIDDALNLTDAEQANYRQAMEYAWLGEPVVWHSSRVGTGWVPAHFSAMQHEAEASPAWGLGYAMGSRYAKIRADGIPAPDAIIYSAGLALMDVSGVLPAIEAVSGSEAITGRKLAGGERLVKGLVGVVSLATLRMVGGPRIAAFAGTMKGTRAALVQLELAGFSVRMPAAIVGRAGAVLALTESEAYALAQAGLLQMSSIGAGGRPPPTPAPGLRGVYGKTRGGGSEKARAYQKKVTGRDDSVFVNGVEFDGWRPKDKALLDAKLAKGEGSFYDVTTKDRFTERIKIPEIVDQAKRQIAAMKNSGAERIEWVVSDRHIAETLDNFFKKKKLAIDVVYGAP